MIHVIHVLNLFAQTCLVKKGTEASEIFFEDLDRRSVL